MSNFYDSAEANKARIGRRGDGANPFGGRMKQMVIWSDLALTEQDVADTSSEIYNGGSVLALPKRKYDYSTLFRFNDVIGDQDFANSGQNNWPNTGTNIANVQISDAESKFYGRSCLFDGSGFFGINGSRTLTMFGNGEWSFDCWAKLQNSGISGSTGQHFFGTNATTGGKLFDFRAQESDGVLTGKVQVLLGNGSTFINPVSTISFTPGGGFVHFACFRYDNGSSSDVYVAIDGVVEKLATNPTIYMADDQGNVTVAWSAGSTINRLKGYLNDWRTNVGKSLFTDQNFTPSENPVGANSYPYWEYLRSYWKLDDTSDSHEFNTLTNNGSVDFTNPGVIGNCATFDGTNHLNVLREISRNKTTITFSAWVYFNTTGTVDYILNEATNVDGKSRIAIYKDSSDQLVIGMRDTSSGSYLSASSVNTFFSATKYHFLAHSDTVNDKIHGYVNGTEWINESVAMGNFYDATAFRRARMGLNISNINGMEGWIDDIALYDELTLTSGEVASLASQLYNSGNALPYPPVAENYAVSVVISDLTFTDDNAIYLAASNNDSIHRSSNASNIRSDDYLFEFHSTAPSSIRPPYKLTIDGVETSIGTVDYSNIGAQIGKNLSLTTRRYLNVFGITINGKPTASLEKISFPISTFGGTWPDYPASFDVKIYKEEITDNTDLSTLTPIQTGTLTVQLIDEGSFVDVTLSAGTLGDYAQSLPNEEYYRNYFRLDSVSNGKSGPDLTNVNSVSFANTGKLGNCATFDGTNYLQAAPTTGQVSRDATHLQVHFWVNFDALGSDEVIINESTNGSDIYSRLLVQKNSDNTLLVGMRDTSTGSLKSATSVNTFSAGTWYFVNVYFDTVNDKIYVRVNNSSWINASVSMGDFHLGTAVTSMRIGVATTGVSFFTGKVDDLGILYDIELDETEFIESDNELWNNGDGKALA
jgi:hypothetical protein